MDTEKTYTYDQIEQLKSIVSQSRKMVFFGGAGVSTESGIPDFRSAEGLYNQNSGKSYPPEQILSATFFRTNTPDFFDFYRSKMLYPQAKPNAAHYKLAEWEREGRLSAVITQNIDGLHQAAGSKNVFELHGSVWRNHCTRCGKSYPFEDMLNCNGVPRCSCGGVIKPDVVLYEEPLDGAVLHGAINALRAADTLIVAGTSLNVYPAAGLIDYFGGKKLIVINKSRLNVGGLSDILAIQGPVGEVLSKV